MKDVIVIHEKELSTREETVIGVADSVENAEFVIERYYGIGNFKEISFRDIRDSSLEYSKVIEVKDNDRFTYELELTLQWFEIKGL